MTAETPPMKPLIDALLAGDYRQAVSEAKNLLAAGVAAEEIVAEGIEVASVYLDEKCTQEVNLLEIMLAGRAVNMVAQELFPHGPPPREHKGTVVLATLEGDIHDLGKDIVKMLLSGRGYKVVDLGVDCPLERIVEAAAKEPVLAVFVSGLITPVIAEAQRIRKALAAKGLSQVKIAAGGAALKQASAEELNVDFVAQSAFDGPHYLDEITRERKAA